MPRFGSSSREGALAGLTLPALMSNRVTDRRSCRRTANGRRGIARSLTELVADSGTSTSTKGFRTGGERQRHHHKQRHGSLAQSIGHIFLLYIRLFEQLSNQ